MREGRPHHHRARRRQRRVLHHQPRAPVQRAGQAVGDEGRVDRIQRACFLRGQCAFGRQRGDQARRGAWLQQRRLRFRIAQHQVLQQELQVDQATRALLQVEACDVAAIELGAHAGPHLHHLVAQHAALARTRQRRRADVLERLQQRGVAGHAARAHQRLVFPCPRALALVLAEAGQRRDQQTLGAIRAQAHVHVVQPARRGYRAEQRDDLLRQPRIPATGFHRACAVGLRPRRCIEQEDEVQVRPEAEFLAAQAAVADHREPPAGDKAMDRRDIARGDLHDHANHFVGQPRQLAHAVARRLATVERGQRHAEAQREPPFVQYPQAGFRVVFHQRRLAFDAQLVAVGHRAGDAGVQQFVQQQGILRQPLGQQRTTRQHVDQPAQRTGLFVQQRQVAGAAQDRLQQRQDAPQCRIRLRRPGAGIEQGRQHAVEPRTRRIRQRAHAAELGELAQRTIGAARIGESGRGQRFRIAAVGQRPPVQRQRIRRGVALAGREQFGELGRHPRALQVQCHAKAVPVGMIQAARDAMAVQRVFRQRMRLRVAQHLQAVLQPAQESVGLRQRIALLFRHLPRSDQRGQGHAQSPLAQRGFAPAADQLQGLHQELDFADAAGPPLDIVGQLAARDLRGDGGLHLAQAVQRGVVQVAAVDERPQRLQPALARVDVAGHGTCLQPGITFPVASFTLEVLVHAGERKRHPSGVAERTQAQVDAVAEAVDGRLVQQLRQPLAQPHEVVLGGERSHAVRLPALRIRVDQVDVGGEVKFAAAQLAQAEHHQALHTAVGRAHHAMALRELGFQRVECSLQADFRQSRGAGQRVVDRVQAMHVAPYQARGFGRAIAAKQLRPLRGVVRDQRGHRPRRSAIVVEQGCEKFGLPAQCFQREIAGGDHARNTFDGVRVGQHRIHVHRRGSQARQSAFGQCFKLCIEGEGRVVHRGRLWHGPTAFVGATSVATADHDSALNRGQDACCQGACICAPSTRASRPAVRSRLTSLLQHAGSRRLR